MRILKSVSPKIVFRGCMLGFSIIKIKMNKSGVHSKGAAGSAALLAAKMVGMSKKDIPVNLRLWGVSCCTSFGDGGKNGSLQ